MDTLVLLLILGGSFQSVTTKHVLTVHFLYQVEEVLRYSWCVEYFYHEMVLNFATCFFLCLLRMKSLSFPPTRCDTGARTLNQPCVPVLVPLTHSTHSFSYVVGWLSSILLRISAPILLRMEYRSVLFLQYL